MKALRLIFGYLFLFLFLSSCMQPSQNFSESVTQFHKKTKGTSALFFYPAVIQTLNFTHDSTFAEATKDIRKIEIIRLSKDSIPKGIADTLIDNIKGEKFLNLMEAYREGSRINLFMKKNHGKADHFVAVVYSPKSMMVVDALGEVPFKYLPMLLNKNVSLDGFETVLNAKPKPRKRKSKTDNGKHTRNK